MANLPNPDEVVVLVHVDGAQQGPMSRRTLAQRVAAGEISRSAHFWFDGWPSWTPISEHPDVVDALQTATKAAGRAPGESDDDYSDRVFSELVNRSWDWHDDHAFAGHVDEVFLGAVITSTLDTGYSLIDITSDGSHHYLRFEELKEKTRVIIRITHLTSNLTVAKVVGHRASVIIGYGERVGNIANILSALRAEMKSDLIQNAEPGTISVDGDVAAGYVYCQVDLTFTIDDYVNRKYQIDYERLSTHISATTHALRKYLRGRFQ